MAKPYRLELPARYKNFPAGSMASMFPVEFPTDTPLTCAVYGLPGTGVSVPTKLSTVKAASVPLPIAVYTNFPEGCAVIANICPLVANGVPDALVSVPTVALITYPLIRVLEPSEYGVFPV